MMRVLTIAIPDDVDEALRDIALREFRRPRDQASVLLIEAVRRVQDEQARPRTDTRPDESDDRPTAA